jgi:uncharacterized lipoprotein YajG
MIRLPIVLVALGSVLTGCRAPPHIFVVTTDVPATKAVLSVNGQTVALSEEAGRFAGDTAVVEGAGKIAVTLSSGQEIVCAIGYFTNGEFEPHRFAVKNGVCEGA